VDNEYLESLFGLADKVAAVTGGGGVLCGAMSRALARAGAKVAVMDLNEEAARRVADDVAAAGGEAIGVRCDVLDKASVEAAAQEVLRAFGQVDILINGAGGNKKQATTSLDLAFFVSSMNALRPLTRIPAYSAAKAAVSNFTQWLAVHVAQEYSPRIRVNALAPGFFLTEQNRFLLTDEATGKLTPRGKTIIAHTPMGRFGDPEHLIGTMLWLLSPGAEFVTGIVVPVDGGFSAFSGV
jgi:NAD(P)-dependent dehydrogenase (short-subunit alcohol dehydrogenase family)